MPPKKDKKAPNRSRGANWTEVETKILIDVLRENFPDFRKAKRKNGVYEKMWIEMKDRGVQRSLKQIKDRHKVLHNKFKSEKKEHSETGSSPSEWPYYEACAPFMDSIPLNDHETVDSLEEVFTEKRSTQVKDARDKPSTSRAASPNPEIDEDDFEGGKGAATSEKEDESETVRKKNNPTKDLLVSDQMSDTSEEEDELGASQSKKRPAKKTFETSEDEENEQEINKKKKVPPKKRSRVSVIEIITEEMQASREASSNLAQTLNTTLTGFTPFLQNLGASLQMLPQLLQQQPTPPPTPFHYHYPPQFPNQFNQGPSNQSSFNQGPFNQGHVFESQRYPAGPAIQPDMIFNPNAIPPQNNFGNEPQIYNNDTCQQL